MAGQAQAVSKDQLWSGGQSPFGISYGKMMMWYFLVSDALTFGGLLTAYGVIRHGSADLWPVGEQVFESLPGLHGSYPLIYVALMTFILIISSVTMVLAVEAGHRMDKKGVIKWMGYTVLGGFFFLGSQAWEWSHFIHGSGGGFQVNAPMTVAAVDNHNQPIPMELTGGSWVHMTADMGHAYEHALEHGDQVVIENGKMVIMPAAHAGPNAHGHEAHGTEAHAGPQEYPLELVLNKYTLEHKDGKDLRKLTVTGEEAEKIMKNMASNTLVFGANLHKNEYAVQQQYANFFFFITGFHGFHVLQGVIINLIIFLMAVRGVFERRGHYEMVEKVGLFWHFVDLVWVFVFTFFYLV
ncbi:MAG: cytochrome c oxidase subunit 3 [Flavobacteriales bacterium]